MATSLPSCLARRASSESASSSVEPIPIHRPSLPIYHRRQDELTVPLRDCCADCQRITEQCLKEGNDWKEKFSRGARRRRSASLEYSNKPALPHTRNASLNGAFTPFSTEGSASRDTTSRFATNAAFSITVDEVDKRRRSFDFSMDDTDLLRTQQSHPSASPFASSSGRSVYPRVKPRDREREPSSSSPVSSESTIDESLPSPDTLDSRSRLRSSPIEEEDETQLFPLPRRSCSKTPSPSPPPSLSLKEESSSPLPIAIPSPPYLTPTSSKCPSDENILPNSSTEVDNNTQCEISDQNTPSPLAPRSPNSPSIDNNINSTGTSPFKPKLKTAVTVTNQKPTPPSAFSNHTTPSLIAHQKPSPRKRKISFTLPFIKAGDAIRDVGADVLRGVSSISGTGGMVGSVWIQSSRLLFRFVGSSDNPKFCFSAFSQVPHTSTPVMVDQGFKNTWYSIHDNAFFTKPKNTPFTYLSWTTKMMTKSFLSFFLSFFFFFQLFRSCLHNIYVIRSKPDLPHISYTP